MRAKNFSGDSEPLSLVPERRHSVVSLFSGCGGMDLGFIGGFKSNGIYYRKNEFEVIWANEINTAACRTYRWNIGDHIYEGDICDRMQYLPGYADVVIGGFPCQDISINNKNAKGVFGKRSSLYRAMVEAVKRLQPKCFVAENVKSLLNRNNRESLNKILRDFSEIGYNVTYKLYNAADYGVPQTRERVIIVGTQCGTFFPPKPTHAKDKWISAKSVLHSLENHPRDEEWSHTWSLAAPGSDQGSRRLYADRPGYTMRAECHGNTHFHYSLPRRMTMREGARIQSFPDDFIFKAKLRETERQIGNAVPPVFAWHIATSIDSMLKEVVPAVDLGQLELAV